MHERKSLRNLSMKMRRSGYEAGSTERYVSITAVPPNGSITCYELGRRIRVVCQNANGTTILDMTVTYWTGQMRCYNS